MAHALSVKGVKSALAAFFCYCAVETTTGLWGASFLVTAKGVSAEIAARWISLYYIGITFGRFLSGFLTIKLNSRQMVRLGQAVILAGVIILLLPLGNGALLPGLFLVGLGCAPIFPSLLQETPENFGAHISQEVIGLQMASAYVGTSLAPLLFGWLSAIAGFAIFPAFIGIALLLHFLMVELVNHRRLT
jgi:fucose permease